VHRTDHLVSFFHALCLEIGGRAGERCTVLMTVVGSVHNPKIMLGVLIEVLRSDSIATCGRLPRESNVTFKDLMRGAPNLYIGTVTIEGCTSAWYLLPITVGIVTVIVTMRSAGLSWSHDTCCIDGKLDRYSMRAYRNTSAVTESDDVAPFFYTAPSSSQRHARWLIFN
jgi:hypothetical protein